MRTGCGRRFAAGIALIVPLTAAAQPITLPPAVLSACNDVHAHVSKTAGARVTRHSESVRDEMMARPFDGCRVRVDGSHKQLGNADMPTTVLERFFEQCRWSQLAEFSADGHDGTVFAYARDSVACIVRGEWDGGSDDEPNAPVADPYLVTIACGPRASFVRPQ